MMVKIQRNKANIGIILLTIATAAVHRSHGVDVEIRVLFPPEPGCFGLLPFLHTFQCRVTLVVELFGGSTIYRQLTVYFMGDLGIQRKWTRLGITG